MSGLHLVLRQSGVLYALPVGAVGELCQDGAGVHLRFAGTALAADAVAGLAHDLACRDAGAVWRRFLPRGGVALALWQEQPVLVLAADGVVPANLAAVPDASLPPIADPEQLPGKDTAA